MRFFQLNIVSASVRPPLLSATNPPLSVQDANTIKNGIFFCIFCDAAGDVTVNSQMHIDVFRLYNA